LDQEARKVQKPCRNAGFFIACHQGRRAIHRDLTPGSKDAVWGSGPRRLADCWFFARSRRSGLWLRRTQDVADANRSPGGYPAQRSEIPHGGRQSGRRRIVLQMIRQATRGGAHISCVDGLKKHWRRCVRNTSKR